MLLLVWTVIAGVGILVATAQSLADAARLPGLGIGTRVGWFAIFLAGPVVALLLGAVVDAVLWNQETALGALLAAIWTFAAPWAFLLVVRRPRLALEAGSFRSAWREGGAAARRAWGWHGALVLLLLVGAALWVPFVERGFKGMGGAVPAPTQLLLDLSRDVRRHWLFTVPVIIPLAYVTYRVYAMLLRVGRASSRGTAAYAALVNAALVLVALFFFAFAATLPVLSIHSSIK